MEMGSLTLPLAQGETFSAIVRELDSDCSGSDACRLKGCGCRSQPTWTGSLWLCLAPCAAAGVMSCRGEQPPREPPALAALRLPHGARAQLERRPHPATQVEVPTPPSPKTSAVDGGNGALRSVPL